jgi:SAM-dependent methyltransferase
MDGSFGNLRLYPAAATGSSAELPALPHEAGAGPAPDPVALANRELIRPPTFRRGPHHLDPFSAAWFDELLHKRYERHGRWLAGALEFGRHPGESLLILNPGVGSDAVRHLQQGAEVTVAAAPTDHPHLIRENLARHGLTAPLVATTGTTLPFPDGAFDVAVWNGLHTPAAAPADELFRVLKAGGKVIGLFPARFDAGYWQDLLLPLQHLYWRHPPDPTAAPKTTRRELARVFARFGDHRVRKRHLRRSELPHLWRLVPLLLLERLIGRVLVLKAFKPLSTARTATHPALPDSRAA